MRHRESTFCGHDGLELYYQRWEQDNGDSKATFIIIHGLGDHSGRYMNLVNVLVANGICVLAFDIRGHGRSPGKRGAIGQFSEFRQDVDAFVDLIRSQQPQDLPLFLMGHSLGGLIVLDVALHGISGVDGIIISSPALDSGGISAFLMSASKVLSRIWPNLGIKTGLDVSGISRDPDVVTAYHNDPLTHGIGTPRLATESSKTMSWCFDNAERLDIPILMIHGSSDRITSPQHSRQFFEQITHADKTYLAFEGGFHSSHNDIDHEQATSEILNWLEARCLPST